MDKREVIDFFKDLVIIVAIVLFIRTFIAMPFQINGQSMYSSYYDREFIIVDRFSYYVSAPKRGDVIVFKPHVSEEKQYFLKRIVGVPGDSIKISDGKVYLKQHGQVKYKELNETYLNEENKGFTYVGGSKSTFEYKVGNGEYFVLGDNRNHSTDSRECFSSCAMEGQTNFIKTSDITGKLFLDLGYFNFKEFSFMQPYLGIDTTPRFLDTPKSYTY